MKTGRAARRCTSALGLALLVLVPSPTARAADEDTVLRLRGIRLAAEGRCEEALARLEPALAASPDDREAAMAAATCEIRLGRHEAASTRLAALVERSPDDTDAWLHLGIARFHAGDVPGAEAALDAAAERGARGPELELYRGLLMLERARARDAAAALERARAADAQGVDPIASYYAAMAWADLRETERAEEALRRVREQAPGTVWAVAAERALDRLRGTRDRERWLQATVGFEYDDNVVLRADGVALPGEIEGAHDVRAVWALEAGGDVWSNADWNLGARATVAGSLHQDLEDFNLLYPTGSLWLDRRLSERTTASLQYDAGYVWYQGDPYLGTHAVVPSLAHSWGDAGTTRLYTRLYRHNFLFATDDVVGGAPGSGPGDLCAPGAPPPSFCGPPGFDEGRTRNRDGNGVAAGFEHVWPLPVAGAEVRGGYLYDHYGARGRDYSYDAHGAYGIGRVTLPAAFVLDGLVGFTYRPYRNASSFPDPQDVVPNGTQYRLRSTRRRDEVWRFEAGLSRALGDHVTASVRYRYYDQDSNVQVFDYDREVLGVYLTVGWRP